MDVSGDVIAAATTLAGLVLVFLGATSTSYESYAPILRNQTIRARFRRRGWFGFIGFMLSLCASALALAGKWLHIDCYVQAALMLFGVSLLWVLVAAFLSVRDIK